MDNTIRIKENGEWVHKELGGTYLDHILVVDDKGELQSVSLDLVHPKDHLKVNNMRWGPLTRHD
jgi:hypothetical protein